MAGSAEWGGGERYLETLVRGLDRDRFVLSVVLPGPGPFVERLERLGITARIVDLGRLLAPAAVVRLAGALRPLAPHVVQSHGARSNFYARLATALLGTARHLSTVHNSLRAYPVSALRKAVYRSMDRVTLPLTARVLCVAEALAGDYRGRATVIPNGVELAELDAARGRGERVRRELGLGGAAVVGFAGRLTPQKDPLTFLRALAAVRRERPDVTGLLVGDGPLRADLVREAARLGLSGHCVLAGLRADVPALLDAMDVFVLPSVSEGFPFVVLEAMAMSRPVVATAVDGVSEIVEDGVSGILVPAGEPAAVAARTLDLLRRPERARALGAAARARVVERFSAETMVRRTRELWTGLVASP